MPFLQIIMLTETVAYADGSEVIASSVHSSQSNPCAVFSAQHQ
jgi:hypothetical protein